MISDRTVQFLKNGGRGGFVAKLIEAWQVADSSNQARIEKAFKHELSYPADVWTWERLKEKAPSGLYWYRSEDAGIGTTTFISFKENSGKVRFPDSSHIVEHPEVFRYYGPIHVPEF